MIHEIAHVGENRTEGQLPADSPEEVQGEEVITNNEQRKDLSATTSGLTLDGIQFKAT